MTVGRKGQGRRHEEYDDDDNSSENSDQSSPLTLPPTSDLLAYTGFRSGQEHRSIPYGTSLNRQQLPNFKTFLQDTFYQRGTSMPGLVTENNTQSNQLEPLIDNNTRSMRTLSGTWLKEHRSLDAHLYPRSLIPGDTLITSRPLPVPHQSLAGQIPGSMTNS